MSIFDWIPTLQPEPEVGEYVESHGANICHIMRPSYIGKKVVFDCSTESHKWYKVGILEQIIRDHYYQWNGSDYEKRPCDRVVIYTGKKERSRISLMPGREIFECLPWDAYPERMGAIGKR